MPRTGVTEGEIAAAAADGELCEDPAFPPAESSLYLDPQCPPASAPKAVEWKRTQGHLYTVPQRNRLKVSPVCWLFPAGHRSGAAALFLPRCEQSPVMAAAERPFSGLLRPKMICCERHEPAGRRRSRQLELVLTTAWQDVRGKTCLCDTRVTEVDTVQGCLRNHWFLGAVAAVSSARPDLLLDLIVSADLAERGLYTFQFFKHGRWHAVVVDNHLPCAAGTDEILFSCSGDPGETWLSLLEKAYAKLHGTYFSLSAGSLGDALVDLTGGVLTKHSLAEAAPASAPSAHEALWSQLQGWGLRGCIVAAVCKRRPTAAGAQGLQGLLPGVAYPIVGTRTLPDGTRLVSLHNPWPSGAWLGAWSAGHPSWTGVAAADTGAAAQGDRDHGDDAAFYISLDDLVRTFSKLYVVHLYPPDWWQLTLRSGWRGQTSGGPPLSQDGRPCATFCCNPQFLVTARARGHLHVAVSQRDGLLEHGIFVPKRRREPHGFLVVRVPSEHHGRIWSLSDAHVVHDSGVSGARELSASLEISPEHCLMVVPHMHAPGAEGPFVLRTFASVKLEVSQMPAPFALVVGGSWTARSAGGRCSSPAWPSNPQMMVAAPRAARVMATLTASGAEAGAATDETGAGAIGLVVAEPGMTDRGPGRTRSASSVVTSSAFDSADAASLLLQLPPNTPRVLVPSGALPGVDFELRLISPVPLELAPLPDARTVVQAGAWGATGGGCNLHLNWFKNNPQFLLTLESCSELTASITLASRRRHRRRRTLDGMIGFYVLSCGSQGTVVSPGSSVLAEAAFVPDDTCEMTCTLKPSEARPAFLVVPCTFAPRQTGAFELAVSSSSAHTFQLEPFQAGV